MKNNRSSDTKRGQTKKGSDSPAAIPKKQKPEDKEDGYVLLNMNRLPACLAGPSRDKEPTSDCFEADTREYQEPKKPQAVLTKSTAAFGYAAMSLQEYGKQELLRLHK